MLLLDTKLSILGSAILTIAALVFGAIIFNSSNIFRILIFKRFPKELEKVV